MKPYKFFKGLGIYFISFFIISTSAASELVELMSRCAPTVHPTTLSAIIRTESGGNKYALADAGPGHLPWRIRKNMVRSFYPQTLQDAAGIARGLIDKGHIVAIGLTQLSSRNLKRLGLTVEEVLEPCTNLRSGGQILTEFYMNALKKYQEPNQALLAAISAYNTGNFQNGFSNGYVKTVLSASLQQVPQLKTSNQKMPRVYSLANNNVRGVHNHSRQNMLLKAKLATIEISNQDGFRPFADI
jgi:type IV secretion system protein VirB1